MFKINIRSSIAINYAFKIIIILARLNDLILKIVINIYKNDKHVSLKSLITYLKY